MVQASLPEGYMTEELGRVAVGGRVHAIIRFSFVDIPSITSLMSAAEWAQVDFWNDIVGSCVLDNAYRIRIQSVLCHPNTPAVHSIKQNKYRSLFAVLESGQSEQLLAGFADVPEWATSCQSVFLRLPDPYAKLVATGSWTSLILPHVISKGSSSRSCRWNLFDLTTCPLPTCSQAFGFPVVEFDGNIAQECADMLRCALNELDKTDEMHPLIAQRYVHCIAALHAYRKTFDVGSYVDRSVLHRHKLSESPNPKAGFAAQAILQTLMLANEVRDSGRLVKICKNALLLSVPPLLQRQVMAVFDEIVKAGFVPSAASVSRWRPLLDIAGMIAMRLQNDKKEQEYTRYMMYDSSFQRGRDFENIVVSEFPNDMVVPVFRARNKLATFWHCIDHTDNLTDKAQEEEELECHQFLVSPHVLAMFVAVVLPLLGLASGHTTLRDKFCVVLWAILLVASDYVAGLKKYLMSIVCCTSDMGTEKSLHLVKPIRLRKWFPFLRDSPSLCGQQDANWDGMDIEDLQMQPEDPLVSLQHTLTGAGLLHIIQNAGSSTLAASGDLAESMTGLKACCDILRVEHTCQRVRETCFTTPVASCFHSDLRKFHAECYEKRWGTVAAAIPAVLFLRCCLIRFFDKSRYLHGMHRESAVSSLSAGEATNAQKIEDMHDAVHNPLFWARLMTLNCVFSVIITLLSWSEGCQCHWHLDLDEVPSEVRKRWSRCVFRSRRMAEICAGDFFDLCRSLLTKACASVYMALQDLDISEEQRGECLRGFERCRSHLLFCLVLKLAFCCEPPTLLFACTHYKIEKCLDALRRCLHSRCKHPLILQLQREPLASQAEVALEGMPLDRLPELEFFVARLALAFSAERGVERPHAQIMAGTVAGRGGRTSQGYDSLKVRFTYIERQLEEDPSGFANIIAVNRNYRKCLKRLGIDQHPHAIRHSRSAWSHHLRNIVYHTDPWSLFHATLPDLHSDGGDNNDGDHLVEGDSGGDVVRARVVVTRAMSDGHYNNMYALAAQEYFLFQLSDDSISFFSVKAHPGSIRTLLEVAAPDTDGLLAKSSVLQHARASEVQAGSRPESQIEGIQQMFFTVVMMGVSRKQRYTPGDFKKGSVEVGISIHEIIKQGVLSMSPVSFGCVSIHSILDTCILLNVADLDLDSLLSLRKWSANLSSPFLSMTGGDTDAASFLLAELLKGRCNRDLVAGEAYETCVSAWVEGGLVKDEGDAYVLSHTGLTEASIGIPIKDCKPAMRARSLDVCDTDDMYIFELMQMLEDEKWTCVVVHSKGQLAKVQGTAYDVTREGCRQKVWYMNPVVTRSLSSLKSLRFYILCLLTASKHEKPVHHFDTLHNYRKLLDPNFEPKKKQARSRKKKMLLAATDEAWEGPVAIAAPEQKRRRISQSMRLNAEDSESAPDGDASDSDGHSDGSAELESSSSSSSSSSKNSKSSSSSTESRSKASSSCGTSKAKSKAKSKSKARAKRAVVSGKPSSSGSFPFGLECLVTPRYIDGSLSGYQMKCREHRACTKELAFRVAGSEEDCLRMLKTWALWGFTVTSKVAHVECWQAVLDDHNDGRLLSQAELDDIANSMLGHEDLLAPRVDDDHLLGGSLEDDDLLGEKDSCVPSSIHEKALQLVREGTFPRTKPAARKRASASTSEFCCPDDLWDYLKYGYIHPNVGAPSGYVWKHKGGKWTLGIRGG